LVHGFFFFTRIVSAIIIVANIFLIAPYSKITKAFIIAEYF